MWFGVTHLRADEAPEAQTEMALVAVYRPDGSRVMRIGAPLSAVTDLIRMIRGAGHDAPRGRPRCEHCGSDFEIPDLDAINEEEPCSSI